MTEHHDDPNDITAEFWGSSPSWRSTDEHSGAINRPSRRGRAGRGTGGVRPERTRSHRIIEPGAPSFSGSEASSGAVPLVDAGSADDLDIRPFDFQLQEPVGGSPAERSTRRAGGPPQFDDRQSAHDEPSVAGSRRPALRRTAPERPSLAAIDPLLARLGMLIAVGVLLVPIALAFRPSDEHVVRTQSPASAGGVSFGSDRSVALERLDPTSTAVVTDDAATAGATMPGTSATRSSAGDPVGATSSVADPATTTAAATPTARQAEPAPVPCAGTYTVHAGDYWLRLADEAGVELGQLLAANGARPDTAIYPGDDICIPAGGAVPSPPPTTTAPPVTTTPPTTAAARPAAASGGSGSSAPAPTTATAPAASIPPATAAPRPTGSTESPEQVQAIIREVWPDELEERAITIARRESNFRPGAYNGHCCYGVFQIYWSVHRNWLANHGVTSSAQLLDARTNVQMAYQLYLRSGSWRPWSQTAY